MNADGTDQARLTVSAATGTQLPGSRSHRRAGARCTWPGYAGLRRRQPRPRRERLVPRASGFSGLLSGSPSLDGNPEPGVRAGEGGGRASKVDRPRDAAGVRPSSSDSVPSPKFVVHAAPRQYVTATGRRPTALIPTTPPVVSSRADLRRPGERGPRPRRRPRSHRGRRRLGPRLRRPPQRLREDEAARRELRHGAVGRGRAQSLPPTRPAIAGAEERPLRPRMFPVRASRAKAKPVVNVLFRLTGQRGATGNRPAVGGR